MSWILKNSPIFWNLILFFFIFLFFQDTFRIQFKIFWIKKFWKKSFYKFQTNEHSDCIGREHVPCDDLQRSAETERSREPGDCSREELDVAERRVEGRCDRLGDPRLLCLRREVHRHFPGCSREMGQRGYSHYPEKGEFIESHLFLLWKLLKELKKKTLADFFQKN